MKGMPVFFVDETGDVEMLTLFRTEDRAREYAAAIGKTWGTLEILSDSAAGQLIIDAGAARDEEREHSERARYVTDQVKLWIANDAEHYEEARGALRRGGMAAMAEYVRRTLSAPNHGTAAWHVAQELSPNDVNRRIHWSDVVDELLGE